MSLAVAVTATTALVMFRTAGVVVEAAMDHGFDDDGIGLLLDDTSEANEFWDETLPYWTFSGGADS